MSIEGLPHLLAIADLNAGQISGILEVARKFSKIPPSQSLSILNGTTVVNLFMESSTRTRISFEMAIRRLGGSVLNFTGTSSSLDKGETLLDTAKNILAMQPHCLVVRHSASGAPVFLSRTVKVPILNAGDGFHEHPTQAL